MAGFETKKGPGFDPLASSLHDLAVSIGNFLW